MRRFVPRLLPALVLIFALTTPSHAQYMYLDTNGDGASTSADAISPSGPTTLDVWLRTDFNRDGTQASCATQDGDFTLNSYEFILHASGGSLAWTGFVNRQTGMSANLGEGSSESDYHNGFGGGVALPPGTYHLASVTVEVAAGTPDVSIASSTSLSPIFLTSFASLCSGNDFDNTLKLGSDWFGVDGVPYGGALNRAPVIDPPAGMTVVEGTVQEQDIHAIDPDGDPVTMALSVAPSYVSFTPLSSGVGEALGRLRVAPGYQSAGIDSAVLVASDGFKSDRRAVALTIVDVNTAPTLSPLEDVAMLEGDTIDRPLIASDPEGDRITFALLAGPAFVRVDKPGSTVGRVRVAPGFADAGVTTATIGASDGFLTDQKSFQITVNDPHPAYVQILCQPAGMLVLAGSVAEQMLYAASPDGEPATFTKVSGPGFVTVTTLSSSPGGAVGKATAAPGPSDIGAFDVVVAATTGIKSDSHSFTVTVGDERSLPSPERPLYDASSFTAEVDLIPQSLAAGDLDRDGDLDLMTANLSGTLTVLRGRGDGVFERRVDIPVGRTPYSASIADLNGDGRPDLVMVDSTLDVVSVIDGTGECTFGYRRDFATGNRPAHVLVGDWNEDSRPDLAVADEGENTISILLGAGDGTFGSRTSYPIGRDPCYSDAGDFNGDRHLDLVISNEFSDNLSVLLGNGDGTFRDAGMMAVGDNPRSVKVGDFNGDGWLDVAAANFWEASISVLLGNGDGTFRNQTLYPSGNSPWSIAARDLNADGRPDLVTANTTDNTVSVFFADGGGAFPIRTDYPAGRFARFVVLGDANADGHPDILVSSEAGMNVVTLLGDGRGAFRTGETVEVGQNPVAVTAGDWDGDGRRDLAVSNDESRTISIFLGGADGTLRPAPNVPTASPPGKIVTGDWDLDGRMDLVVPHTSGPNLFTVYRGGGDGTFTIGTPYPGAAALPRIEAGDVNDDGLKDLIVSITASQELAILLAEPGGTFRAHGAANAGGFPNGHSIGDLNRDGFLDIAVSRLAPNGIAILLGDGAGAFTPSATISLPAMPREAKLADFDGDGALDLASSTVSSSIFAGGSALHVALGHGDGTFGPLSAMAVSPFHPDLATLDANGDGRTDLALLHELSGVALFLGLGNGQFAPKVDFGVGRRISDIEGVVLSDNGRVDLVAPVLGGNSLVILRNRGTFTPVDDAPVVTAPELIAVRAGTRVEFQVMAADPNNDPIVDLIADLSGLPPGSDATFRANAERTAGTFVWTTQLGDAGSFAVNFTASNTLFGSATTRIDVGPPNRPPVASAGGPYTGSVGAPVAFDGRGSTDPDGDALALTWDFGDGASGSGAQPMHTYHAEDAFEVALRASDGHLSATDLTTATIGAVLAARVFPAPRNRVIRLFQLFAGAFLELEPIDRSFALADVDVETIVLRSEGTGVVDEIHPVARKSVVRRDRDHNGVPELSLFFTNRDLRKLFAKIVGRKSVPVTLEGALVSGAVFRADFTLEVIGVRRFPDVCVAPNPMNPEATLTVATSRGGRLRAAIFDAGGRLVRRLVDLPAAAPGFHELRFDGRAEAGPPLASGIYFYRVETAEGTTEGRIVLVR